MGLSLLALGSLCAAGAVLWRFGAVRISGLDAWAMGGVVVATAGGLIGAPFWALALPASSPGRRPCWRFGSWPRRG